MLHWSQIDFLIPLIKGAVRNFSRFLRLTEKNKQKC